MFFVVCGDTEFNHSPKGQVGGSNPLRDADLNDNNQLLINFTLSGASDILVWV